MSLKKLRAESDLMAEKDVNDILKSIQSTICALQYNLQRRIEVLESEVKKLKRFSDPEVLKQNAESAVLEKVESLWLLSKAPIEAAHLARLFGKVLKPHGGITPFLNRLIEEGKLDGMHKLTGSRIVFPAGTLAQLDPQMLLYFREYGLSENTVKRCLSIEDKRLRRELEVEELLEQEQAEGENKS